MGGGVPGVTPALRQMRGSGGVMPELRSGGDEGCFVVFLTRDAL